MPASKRTPAEAADEASAPIEIHNLPPAEVDLPKVVISRVLRDRIRRGVYTPGSKLPSIAALMEMSGAAKNTVRAAVDILSDDGYVRVIVGMGTIITAPEQWPSQLQGCGYSKTDAPGAPRTPGASLSPRYRSHSPA